MCRPGHSGGHSPLDELAGTLRVDAAPQPACLSPVIGDRRMAGPATTQGDPPPSFLAPMILPDRLRLRPERLQLIDAVDRLAVLIQ
jgi:hypothetical protein